MGAHSSEMDVSWREAPSPAFAADPARPRPAGPDRITSDPTTPSTGERSGLHASTASDSTAAGERESGLRGSAGSSSLDLRVPASGLIAAAGAVRSGRRRAAREAAEELAAADRSTEGNSGVLESLKAAGLLAPTRQGGRRRAPDSDPPTQGGESTAPDAAGEPARVGTADPWTPHPPDTATPAGADVHPTAYTAPAVPATDTAVPTPAAPDFEVSTPAVPAPAVPDSVAPFPVAPSPVVPGHAGSTPALPGPAAPTVAVPDLVVPGQVGTHPAEAASVATHSVEGPPAGFPEYGPAVATPDTGQVGAHRAQAHPTGRGVPSTDPVDPFSTASRFDVRPADTGPAGFSPTEAPRVDPGPAWAPSTGQGPATHEPPGFGAATFSDLGGVDFGHSGSPVPDPGTVRFDRSAVTGAGAVNTDQVETGAELPRRPSRTDQSTVDDFGPGGIDLFRSARMVEPSDDDSVPVGLGAAFVKGPVIPTARVPEPPVAPEPPEGSPFGLPVGSADPATRARTGVEVDAGAVARWPEVEPGGPSSGEFEQADGRESTGPVPVDAEPGRTALGGPGVPSTEPRPTDPTPGSPGPADREPGYAAPGRPEPTTPELTNPGPTNPEPTNPEPTSTEPAGLRLGDFTSGGPVPVGPDPASFGSGSPEPAGSESGGPASAGPVPAGRESGDFAPGGPEPAGPGPEGFVPGSPDPVGSEPGNPVSGSPEPGDSEGGDAEPLVTSVVVGGRVVELPPSPTMSPSAARAARRPKSDLSLAELLAEALVAYETGRREDEAAALTGTEAETTGPITAPVPESAVPPPSDAETTAPIQPVAAVRPRVDTWTLPET